ncbi:MAG: porin family protein [Bacteroidota bacterium]
MPELSPNEMDKLFQEGSEQYDFEYQPAAWEQMDALLDQQERRRRGWWWFWGGLSAVLLIAAVSVFHFSKNENADSSQKSDLTEAISNTNSNSNSNSKLTNEATGPSTENNNTANKESGETAQQETALPARLDTAHDRDASPQQPSTTENIPLNERTKKTASSSLPVVKSDLQDQQHELLMMDSSSSTNHEPATEPGQPATSEGSAGRLLDLLPPLPPLSIRLSVNETIPKLEVPIPLPPANNDPKPLPAKQSWQIGLLIGPEFNSVGQGDYSELNWKFGLHAEYRFANRWAVRTGLYFIDMWYDAGQGEYVPEAGFWDAGIPPNSTRGQCDMLEIPLHFSYHLSGFQNNGFYATAGVASYLILEEHYWYQYDNPTPDAVKYWGTQKDERNWLNIGHFSAGYNYYFSNKWSLQAGPYMQLPLKGVGHGAVDIYSLGLNAVVNFKVK